MNEAPIRVTDEPLSAAEKRTWRGFLAWSEAVSALVARDLTGATGLSVPDFEILVRLHETPEGTLTQRDLTESLGWSASRLSHQLARMQARQLLVRTEVGTGRLMSVTLTPHGEREIRAAVRVHAAAVRTHFFGGLDETGMRALRAMVRQTDLTVPVKAG